MAAERKVSFVDERERELFAAASLGEDVRNFLMNDPVGRYLHHRAKQTVKQSEIDALEVDPDGWNWFRARSKLRQIRQRALAARLVISWLAEAITDGDSAAAELEDYRK